MGAKSKKFILIAAGIGFISSVGIMLLMDNSDKEARKQVAHVKGSTYQSKIVPVNKSKPMSTAKPVTAAATPQKSAKKPAAQKPQSIKPVNKIAASQKRPPAIVHVIKPAVITAPIQPKQQPAKRAVTALKLEEATSIAPRKNPQQTASKVTTKKITTLKLKKSTVVESMHHAWVIQLGSFGNATNAINLRDKLKRAGFASFIEAAQIDNSKITRVYIGPETTLRGAKKILAKLKKEQHMKGIIVGYDG